MTECTTCGSYLSSDYVRVCGDNENEVDTCIHCASRHREEDRLSATSGREASKQDDETATSKLVIPLRPTDDAPRQDQETDTADPERQPADRPRTAANTGEAHTAPNAEEPHAAADTERPHTDRDTRRPRIGQSAERPRTILSAVIGVLR